MPLFNKLFGVSPKIALPVEAFVNITLSVYLPKGFTRTPAEIRLLAESWCAGHAGEHAQGVFRIMVERGWDLFVNVRVVEPASLRSPSKDVACWANATDAERRGIEKAGRVVAISAGQMAGTPPTGIVAATIIAMAVAERYGGTVYDPMASRIVSLAGAPRPISIDTRVSEHITWAATVDTSGMGMMSTHGLPKYGLKGIFWSHYRGWMQRHMLPVANAIAGVLVDSVEAQSTAGSPPREVLVDSEFDLTLDDVKRAYRAIETTAAAEQAPKTTRIGLAREGNRCQVVPPGSYQGPAEDWVPLMLEQLTGKNPMKDAQEMGLHVLHPSQREGFDLSKKKDADTLGELGRLAIDAAKKLGKN